MKRVRAISLSDAIDRLTEKDDIEQHAQTDGERHRSKTERLAGKSVTRRGDRPLKPKDDQALDPALKNLNEVYPDTYSTWRNMKDRARKLKFELAPEFEKFRDFLWHMGSRPHPDLTLDRIDPSRPEYGPGLCRWADKRTQSNNRQNTTTIMYQGVRRPLAEVARITGTSVDTLRSRRKRGCNDYEIVHGRTGNGERKPRRQNQGRNWWPTIGPGRDWWEEKYQLFENEPGSFERSNLSDDAMRSSAYFVQIVAEREMIRCYPEKVGEYQWDFCGDDYNHDLDRFDELPPEAKDKVKRVQLAQACINEAQKYIWDTELRFRKIPKPQKKSERDPECIFIRSTLTPEKAFRVLRAFESHGETAPDAVIVAAGPIIARMERERSKAFSGVKSVLRGEVRRPKKRN